MRVEQQNLNFFGNQLFQQSANIAIIPSVIPGKILRILVVDNLNIGEYGQSLFVDLGEDLTTATALTFIIDPKRGEKQTKTTNISVGTVNATVNDTDFLANQYLIYILQEGDIDDEAFIGTMLRIKGEATVGSKRVSGDYRKIRVLA